MNSILGQTERDFELLALDDGSSDDTVAIARSFTDGRVNVVADGRHLGLVARLNEGLDAISTEYIARMDADDVAAPERLARQIAYMDAHREVAICGTSYKAFHEDETLWRASLPESHERLRAFSLFSSPFAHPTVMIRREPFEAAGMRYDEAASPAEDYDLWERAGAELRLANVQEFLLRYRVHPDQVSVLKARRQREVSDAVRRRALECYGITFSEKEFALHCDLGSQTGLDDPLRVRAAIDWLSALETAARQRRDVALVEECRQRAQVLERQLRKAARRRWFEALMPWL